LIKASIQSNTDFGRIDTCIVSIEAGPKMDARKLRYFTVLAEEKHFGRAARRLSLSQPPLSYAIKQLEFEVGSALFKRNTRKVELTPAGAGFLREAQILLRRMDEAKRLVRSIAEGRSGQLRISFGGSMLYRGLPGIVDDVRKTFPSIDLVLRELVSNDQIEALLRDEIDIGFIHGRAMPEGLAGFCYHAEPFVACVAQQHRLAAATRIRLSQLRHDEFVLFSRKSSPDYFESIVSTCLSAGFLPKVRHEVAHWLSVVSFVANGMGTALVPRTLQNSQLHGARFIPLKEPTILSETWCVWKSPSSSSALDNALQLIQLRSSSIRQRSQARNSRVRGSATPSQAHDTPKRQIRRGK